MTDVRLTATNPVDSSVVPVACNAKGELKLEEPIEFDGNFTGDVTISGNITSTKTGYFEDIECSDDIKADGYFIGTGFNAVPGVGGYAFSTRNADNTNYTIVMDETGAVRVASGNAGFTSDGNLWCTTVRGETVILDSLMNGLGSWVPYVPPSRKDQVPEKMDGWDEKDKL